MIKGKSTTPRFFVMLLSSIQRRRDLTAMDKLVFANIYTIPVLLVRNI